MHTRIQHPGIIFPDEISTTNYKAAGREKSLKIKKLSSTAEKNDHSEWGYSSREAAARIGITIASARQYMHRHGVPSRMGITDKKAMICYWEKSAVDSLNGKKEEELDKIPDGHVTKKQFAAILIMSASAADRFLSTHGITGQLVRLRSGKPGCLYRLFSREDVKAAELALSKQL